MTLKVLPECKGCGECCRGLSVDVTAREADIIPEHLLSLAEGSPIMRQRKQDNSCMALNRKNNTCTIYDIRPRVCRDFKRDSFPCRCVLGLESAGCR